MNQTFWTELVSVPYSQHYVHVNGIRTRVLECGDPASDVVLLLHGATGHAESYIRNLAALGQEYRVLSVDMIAHGFSDRPLDRDYEIPTFVDHLLGLLDSIGVEAAHMSGESLGGWVAARLAMDHPQRVRSLTLNTPGGMSANHEAMARIKKLTLDAVTNPTREKVRDRLAWLFKDPANLPDELVDIRFQIYKQAGFRETTERLMCLQDPVVRQRNLFTEEELRSLAVPTLLIWTRSDPMQGVEAGEWCHRLIAESELVVLEESGHWPQFEQADEFNRIQLDFLRRRGGSTGAQD